MNATMPLRRSGPTPEPALQDSLMCGYPPQQAEAVGRALTTALMAQGRHPGTRPDAVAVARILKQIWADAPTLQAALLVDAGLDPDTVTTHFGERVARWARKVVRLEQFTPPDEIIPTASARTGTNGHVERWRRLLLALASDVRPLLIALARRLETLRSTAPNHRLARETLAVHAPLASRLGVQRLKWELEDLAFRCLEPATYRQLAARLAATRASRENYVNDFISRLEASLHHAGITARVQGRPKHLFSIWKKMQRKQVDFTGLYDLNAVRVIVTDLPICYRVLALIHDQWEPIPEEYDDYIARPKDNGYQSLHTVVRGPGGLAVEIQIRTEAMHTLAEYGMAAHWRYKEGGQRDAVIEHTVAALRRSLQTDAEGGDWFAGQVFVLTPRNQVVCLPAGATPVDFAYAIHTEVGHRCRGARVDGRIAPLDYRLRTGQRVEILTAREGGPNRSWLGQVSTGHARHRIQQWFKRREAEIHHRLGRQRLEREQRRLGLKDIHWPALLQRFRLHQPEEVWLAIGRGEITRGQLATALRETAAGFAAPNGPAGRRERAQVPGAADKAPLAGSQPDAPDLRIQGERDLLTRIARCCRPVPGEPVIGYLTIHHRITIHRRDCPNITHLGTRRNRLVEVVWA